MNLRLTALVAVLVSVVVPMDAHAQGWLGRVLERSRPGQTFHTQPAGAAPRQQAPPAPAQYAHQPAQPYNAAPAAAPKPVILEFSDLHCPDSARFATGLKHTVLQQFVQTGRADFLWKDFPLPKHPQAADAAAAALCAGPATQQVREQIMANIADKSPATYAAYARNAGAPMDQYNACLQQGLTRQQVARDVELGRSMGVTGTPFLVLATTGANGQYVPHRVIKAYNPPEQVLAELDLGLRALGR